MAAALTGPHPGPVESWPTTPSLFLLLFLLPPTQVEATAHRHPASEEVAFSRDVGRTSPSPACGQRHVQGKILGGVDALEGKWPWQASVHFVGFHICGGSIIDEYWILSAAHCFDRLDSLEPFLLGYRMGIHLPKRRHFKQAARGTAASGPIPPVPTALWTNRHPAGHAVCWKLQGHEDCM
ncbi:TPA: protease, serine, 39-like [Bos taurus]|nr:TPA: protease, serine, 39-like [Bos taurus]